MSLLFMNKETRQGFSDWLTFLQQSGQFKAKEQLEGVTETYSHPDSPDLMICARDMGRFIVPIRRTEYVCVAEKGMNHRRARVSPYEWDTHVRHVVRETRLPGEFSILFGGMSEFEFKNDREGRGYRSTFQWNMNGGLINHCGGDPYKSDWGTHT